MPKPALHVLQHMMSTRWAITREALERMLAIAERSPDALFGLGARAESDATPDADADASVRRPPRPPRWALLGAPATAHPQSERVGVRDGVAILPITGPLCRYAGFLQEICGLTSYQLAADDLRIALEDPSITAIMLHLDSPGGETNGCAEFATMVHNARGRKPIVAMVSDGAASAAYWIAAAADEIVVSPSAYVGSIGVYWEVVDDSAREEAMGMRRIRIVSSQSPNKVPDPDDAAGKAVLQREVDEFADAFLSAVARYRGTTADQLIAAGDGGAIFIGRFAVERGLADRVSTTEAELAALAARDTTPAAPGDARSARARATTARHPRSTMPKQRKGKAGARVYAIGAKVTSLVARDAAVSDGDAGTVEDIRTGVTALRVATAEGDAGWMIADEEVRPSARAARATVDEDEDEDPPAPGATVDEDEDEPAATTGDDDDEEAPAPGATVDDDEEEPAALDEDDEEEDAPAMRRALARVAQAHPRVVARIRRDAMQAERARVLALAALDTRMIAKPLKAAIAAGTSPARAAVQLLAATRTAGQGTLATLAGAEAALDAPAPLGTGGVGDAGTAEAKQVLDMMAKHDPRARARQASRN